MLGSFGNGGCEQISAKTVRYLSFGIVCGGVYCVTILVLRTATVRVTVFVSGFAIFFARATTLALDASISIYHLLQYPQRIFAVTLTAIVKFLSYAEFSFCSIAFCSTVIKNCLV
tara:strand:- start:199 stop:543 length:345 start_codon:yes stop_codon:yes gene_type:complete